MKIKILKIYTRFFFKLTNEHLRTFSQMSDVGHMPHVHHCYLNTKNELCYLFDSLVNSNQKKYCRILLVNLTELAQKLLSSKTMFIEITKFNTHFRNIFTCLQYNKPFPKKFLLWIYPRYIVTTNFYHWNKAMFK